MKRLIYISTSSCEPCKAFAPVMTKAAESGIPVIKVNADIQKTVLSEYQVRSVPTVVKVDSLGTMLDKFVGVRTLQEVINFYNA